MRILAVILVLLVSPVAQGAEIFFPGTPGKGVFLPYDKALQILSEVESCRVELPLFRDLAQKDEEVIKTQENRILELGKENEELIKLNQNSIATAEKIRKSEPWYSRVLSTGKWIAIGILVGFAVGAAR